MLPRVFSRFIPGQNGQETERYCCHPGRIPTIGRPRSYGRTEGAFDGKFGTGCLVEGFTV